MRQILQQMRALRKGAKHSGNRVRPTWEDVAELNFPRLKTAATMQSLLIISYVAAAVSLQSKAPKAIINRGKLKPNFATLSDKRSDGSDMSGMSDPSDDGCR